MDDGRWAMGDGQWTMEESDADGRVGGGGVDGMDRRGETSQMKHEIGEASHHIASHHISQSIHIA